MHNEKDNPLEKFTDEELLIELINRNGLGDAPVKTVREVKHYEVIVGIGNDEMAFVTFPESAYLDLRELVKNSQE